MHLRPDRHAIVFVEGAPSESFRPGSWMLDHDRALRAEIEAVFPELATRPTAEFLPSVRRIVTTREARVLAV